MCASRSCAAVTVRDMESAGADQDLISAVEACRTRASAQRRALTREVAAIAEEKKGKGTGMQTEGTISYGAI